MLIKWKALEEVGNLSIAEYFEQFVEHFTNFYLKYFISSSLNVSHDFRPESRHIIIGVNNRLIMAPLRIKTCYVYQYVSCDPGGNCAVRE